MPQSLRDTLIRKEKEREREWEIDKIGLGRKSFTLHKNFLQNLHVQYEMRSGSYRILLYIVERYPLSSL